jgi:hypothetical protein
MGVGIMVKWLCGGIILSNVFFSTIALGDGGEGAGKTSIDPKKRGGASHEGNVVHIEQTDRSAGVGETDRHAEDESAIFTLKGSNTIGNDFNKNIITTQGLGKASYPSMGEINNCNELFVLNEKKLLDATGTILTTNIEYSFALNSTGSHILGGSGSSEDINWQNWLLTHNKIKQAFIFGCQEALKQKATVRYGGYPLKVQDLKELIINLKFKLNSADAERNLIQEIDGAGAE